MISPWNDKCLVQTRVAANKETKDTLLTQQIIRRALGREKETGSGTENVTGNAIEKEIGTGKGIEPAIMTIVQSLGIAEMPKRETEIGTEIEDKLVDLIQFRNAVIIIHLRVHRTAIEIEIAIEMAKGHLYHVQKRMRKSDAVGLGNALMIVIKVVVAVALVHVQAPLKTMVKVEATHPFT